MLPAAFATLLLLPLNQLLRSQPWAAEQLRTHRGKGCEFAVGSFALRLRVTEAGGFEMLPDDVAPAVRLELPASALGGLPDGVDALVKQATVSGDAGFAETLSQLLRHLRPDLGAALEPVLGRVAANRVEQMATKCADILLDSARRAAANLKEYAGEATGPVVARSEFEGFVAEIRSTQTRIAALSAKLR